MIVKLPEMLENEEKQLFEKVQRKDSQALAALMRLLSHDLFAFINRLVENREDVEDILQDTFVRVWEKSHQFKGNSSVRTWIYSIALNLSYSHLRKRNRWHHAFLDEIKALFSGDDPQRDTEFSHEKDLLRQGLTHLSPRQQAVVTARVYQDLPFAQVATAVGCTTNAAKVHFHEAKKRLSAFIEERTDLDG